MRQQPRVPWQVKYLALVLIWGSSFLLMKVGLESLSAVQISGAAHPVRRRGHQRAAAGHGRPAADRARVWGHLFVCGLFLGALPFTLFALSETRISSALAGIGNATTPIVAVLATMAILPGERVTGSRLVAVLVGFLGVVTIMQPWTSVDRPDLVGFSMALVGGASYGIGWTYNRRFLSGVDLGGLSQPAATLLTALVLMVPVMLGWAAFQPEGLAAIWSYDAPDSGTWFWLPLACVLVLGLVGTGFAYMLQFDVVRGAGPVIGSTITYLIPVVSVLLGVLVLGESLGPWQLVGFAIVLERGIRRQPQAARTRGRLGARARAAVSPVADAVGRRQSSASPRRHDGRVGRRPAAAGQHGDDHRDQPQRDDDQQAADDLARWPGAAGPSRARRRGEHGLAGQHRLDDGDAAEHEQQGPPLAPAAAQCARRPPCPPQQAEGDEHERRPDQPHQAAVTGARPGEERDPHPEHDGDDEQRGPHAEQHQARHPPAVPGAPEGRVGREGGGRHPGRGEALTPRRGRAPRGAGSCRSVPSAASATIHTLRGYL